MKTIPGLEIVVIVNNYCAISHCDQDSEQADDSVSCYLLDTQGDERHAESTQYYKFQLPEPMTPVQLDDYFNRSPIDQACLVGVSNNHRYKIYT